MGDHAVTCCPLQHIRWLSLCMHHPCADHMVHPLLMCRCKLGMIDVSTFPQKKCLMDRLRWLCF